MNIVIDTNILISAIIKDSITRKILFNLSYTLLIPELEIIELKRHKQEILNKSKLPEDSLDFLIKSILKLVKLVKTEDVINYKYQADEIIGKIDKDDILFIATALKCNAVIWSDDKHFQQQNKIKILTTKDILKLI